ncbi:hypothetical protein FOTG_19032 [Fusarium oxysporum f. sp. vasinfectum 25433]|uniref:Uncharacterized protein n=1 Tax=Fusarium oxysporum f. sp. vasinfectum 25433 TaxID=1089449 RepID=X0KFV0_FUSOX|nr:hypothetical protein FOTG_19032 [Fusarium oxysporum f. sp. vasinfectum 25433]
MVDRKKSRSEKRDRPPRFRDRIIIFAWLLEWDDSSMSPLVWYQHTIGQTFQSKMPTLHSPESFTPPALFISTSSSHVK